MRTVEGLNGAAMVIVDGSVAVEVAGGPATPETRFQVASVGKQFAAVAVLLLAEQGALALDQPVTRWLPGGPPWWRDVTLHHLLTHTAGLDHWGEAPGFDVLAPMDLAQRVDLIRQASPTSRPGVRWRYSSPGYLLVAHIVERAADQEYGSFLAERIFAPLGMEATTTGPPVGAELAVGHHGGQPVAREPLPPMAGTSDVWSTVGDLARYAEQIHSGALLGWESRAVMTAPLAPTGDEPKPGRSFFGSHYGYGLYVGTVAGHTAYFHPGDVPGFASFHAWLPGRRAGIAVLTGDELADVNALIKQLVAAAALS
jgi:CubicO group peptidase (beta-lactamase class C family)